MAFCDTIKLEKGMYNVGGKNFTKVLEELDPSENYKGTEFENLDAFERQLKRFDIKVSGFGCDKVEKFFSATDSSVLFPEYISRCIKQGINSANVIDSMIAATTQIDGLDYRALSSTTTSESVNVAEGALMKSVNVRTKGIIPLIKHGRVFSSSYEALRFKTLDIVAVILKQIGMDIANEMLTDAVNVLLTGDGTSPDAADEVPISAGGTLNYSYLLTLWENLNPYRLNVMVASLSTMKEILNLPEMKDANAGLNFQGTGKVITPIGANLIFNNSVDAKKILGFDKNFALQMVQSGDIIIDYDRIIDKQLDRAGVSVTSGFSKIFNDTVKLLNYDAT